jgi:xanthine dehydrogenase YagR molybdenum-binding subunit
MGMAAAIRGNFLLPAKCGFTVEPDGTIVVRQDDRHRHRHLHGAGPDRRRDPGVPLGQVRVEIGDSELAPGPAQAASSAATAGSGGPRWPA